MKKNLGLTLAFAIALCMCFTQCKKAANPTALAASQGKLKTNTLTAHPNVLFIIVDDMRYWAVHRLWEDDLARKNDNTPPITPYMDSLIDESVTFTNAHSASVECCPSRTAFLSGKYPYQTGVYNNRDDWTSAVTPSSTLFGQFAADPTNYFSYAAGKVFHCDPSAYYAGGFHFDTSQGYSGTSTLGATNPMPGTDGYDFQVINSNFKDDCAGGTVATTSANQLTEDAKAVNFCIDSLNRVKAYNTAHPTATKSFFMACGLRRPHAKLWVPKYYYDMYNSTTVTPQVVPSTLTGLPAMAQELAADHQPFHSSDYMIANQNTDWRHYLRAYMGCVSYTDYQVGRLMNYLRHSGMYSNTIVVLISDHGFHLGEKHRIKKSTLWEETTRVPMVWHVPGITAAKCTAAVDLMSIYPTLKAYCGLGGTPNGVNIQSLINSPGSSGTSNYALTFTADTIHVGATVVTRPMASVRNGKYRLSQYNKDINQEELYDHTSDAWEGTTLYNANHSLEPGWSVTLRGQLPASTAYQNEVAMGVECDD